jgi:hypothetical protein
VTDFAFIRKKKKKTKKKVSFFSLKSSFFFFILVFKRTRVLSEKVAFLTHLGSLMGHFSSLENS